MRSFRWILGSYLIAAILGLAAILWFQVDFQYAYNPPNDKVLNPPTSSGTVKSAAVEGDVEGDPVLGGKAFATASFGNEVFFSDIICLFDGPFSLPNLAEAVVGLRGQGTSNLKVKAAKDATFAGVTIRKGDIIETGLDVPKGALMPLGVRVRLEDGRPKSGITCLACHATVDDKTGQAVLGVPNTDLNVGYLLAMASNTAAYFTHTDIQNLQTYMKDMNRTVAASDGTEKVLPDPDMLEDAVDRAIIKWPRGSNDTTIDFHNDPVQIPDSITLGKHPYGWSGQGVAGPFKGLTAAINNAHAQNMDSSSQSELSGPVMQIDKEVYLGTLLQRAANPKYRYDPKSGKKPSEFFAGVDPTPGVPGVNQLIPSPSYPKSSYMSAVGLLNSEPGHPAWAQSLGMSAWMNTLKFPEPKIQSEQKTVAEGSRVFQKAQCSRCHAGAYYMNNRIIPVEEIGTEPSRAAGFKATERFFEEKPRIYTDDTPLPLPENPETKPVEVTADQLEQLKLAWAKGDSKGGYKVVSLLGLSWSAPYLHDGGVAVGPDAEKDLGIPGTWNRGVAPDPYNSMKAMIDRNLRKKVMDANKADGALHSAHVTGEGHSFWVDEEAGFTKEEQDSLVRYLLSIKGP